VVEWKLKSQIKQTVAAGKSIKISTTSASSSSFTHLQNVLEHKSSENQYSVQYDEDGNPIQSQNDYGEYNSHENDATETFHGQVQHASAYEDGESEAGGIPSLREPQFNLSVAYPPLSNLTSPEKNGGSGAPRKSTSSSVYGGETDPGSGVKGAVNSLHPGSNTGVSRTGSCYYDSPKVSARDRLSTQGDRDFNGLIPSSTSQSPVKKKTDAQNYAENLKNALRGVGSIGIVDF